MRAIFLSDAHLRQDDTENYRSLLAFLHELKVEILSGQQEGRTEKAPVQGENPSQPIDALYLMGDFFDFWFAKKDCFYPGFSRIIHSLTEIRDLGVHLHIFEGNHDFFLEDYFADRLGIPVYRDDATIDLDGRRFYVAHGDLVDNTNRRYLMLRKFLRSRFIRVVHWLLPSRLVWWIARMSSDTSKAMWTKTGKQLTDKMCRFALNMGARGYDGVILGHSHQPLVWEFAVEGERKVLVTLGDWLAYRSYLDYCDGCLRLKYFQNGVSGDRMENSDFRFA